MLLCDDCQTRTPLALERKNINISVEKIDEIARKSMREHLDREKRGLPPKEIEGFPFDPERLRAAGKIAMRETFKRHRRDLT